MKMFSTAGAEKRKRHGPMVLLSSVTPAEADRVSVVFDCDEQRWQSVVSDQEVPPIMKDAGHKSKPQAALLAGPCEA